MTMHKEYRKKWVSAGYSSRMGSAECCVPPGRLFRRVYHITTTEHAISDISLGRLKVARFSDLNDPFELRAVSFRDPPIRKAIKEFKSAYDSKVGLLCFSSNWTNPVLWSHYGQKHRGICLGFDVSRDKLERVRYKDKRLLSELDGSTVPIDIDTELQKLLRCTKYRHWQYEAEWRRFVPLSDAHSEGRLHFVPFDSTLRLAEVILGPNCLLSLSVVRDLTTSLYPTAIVYNARLAWKFFNVVPQESTVP